MKDAYLLMWHNNGNVALIWHVGTALFFMLCGAMIFYGNRNDLDRDRRRNLDRHHPEDEVFENFEQRRRR